MPIGFTYHDSLMFDLAEVVTYVSAPQGNNVAVTVAGAVPFEVSRAEVIASKGLLTGSERIWWFPSAPLIAAGITTPRAGDKIVRASGETWLVAPEVLAPTGGDMWRVAAKLGRSA